MVMILCKHALLLVLLASLSDLLMIEGFLRSRSEGHIDADEQGEKLGIQGGLLGSPLGNAQVNGIVPEPLAVHAGIDNDVLDELRKRDMPAFSLSHDSLSDVDMHENVEDVIRKVRASAPLFHLQAGIMSPFLAFHVLSLLPLRVTLSHIPISKST